MPPCFSCLSRPPPPPDLPPRSTFQRGVATAAWTSSPSSRRPQAARTRRGAATRAWWSGWGLTMRSGTRRPRAAWWMPTCLLSCCRWGGGRGAGREGVCVHGCEGDEAMCSRHVTGHVTKLCAGCWWVAMRMGSTVRHKQPAWCQAWPPYAYCNGQRWQGACVATARSFRPVPLPMTTIRRLDLTRRMPPPQPASARSHHGWPQRRRAASAGLRLRQLPLPTPSSARSPPCLPG